MLHQTWCEILPVPLEGLTHSLHPIHELPVRLKDGNRLVRQTRRHALNMTEESNINEAWRLSR
jgi:hypothetical protein